ncbi:RNase P modulator RnpM [Lentibacillus sp.]|uniref:RNase P modulator RnpM n=1 Tax=Lentibacillus sp. TaxID=1925746 RepID=UPI002B4B640C|nr:YlxR family protein [Lentibacillus sp.]HLS07825.1 YlxR family protein [Lentibacillus sp.]
MAKKKRKIPQRKCVVTNEMKPKKELIRIVRNKEGEVFVDPTGKKNGRGAYVSNDLAVIEKAEKTGVLGQQLNAEIEPSIYEELKQFVKGHTDEK